LRVLLLLEVNSMILLDVYNRAVEAKAIKFLWKRKRFEEGSWKRKRTRKYLTFWGAGSS